MRGGAGEERDDGGDVGRCAESFERNAVGQAVEGLVILAVEEHVGGGRAGATALTVTSRSRSSCARIKVIASTAPARAPAARAHERCARGAGLSRLATSASLVDAKPTRAFVFARVFAADGAGVAAYVPEAAVSLARIPAVLSPADGRRGCRLARWGLGFRSAALGRDLAGVGWVP